MRILVLLLLLSVSSLLYSQNPQYPQYNPLFYSHVHDANEISFYVDSAYQLDYNNNNQWVVDRLYIVSERNDLGQMLTGNEYEIVNSEPVLSNKWNSGYSDLGSLNYFVNEIWNPDSSDWVLNERQIWNEAGYLTENRDLDWNFELPQACYGWGDVYLYNSNNQVVEEQSLIWNIGGWWNSRRYLYTFDTSGLLTQHIWQKWDSDISEWYNATRWDYFYEGNNNTYCFIYMWNIDTGIWEKSWKRKHDFDSNDWLVEVKYLRPITDSTYQNYIRWSYSRNQMGKEVEKFEESFDTVTNNWKPFIKYNWEYLYDTMMTMFSSKSWKEDTGIWRNVFRRNWEYTNDLQISYRLYESGDWVDWKNDEQDLYEFGEHGYLISYERNDWKLDINDEGYWAPQYREEYYWPIGTEILDKEFSNDNVKIYPNPAQDLLKVKILDGETGTVRICNMNGKELKGIHSLSDNESIDISNLVKGVYLFIIETQSV
ncbi:MAG TPA: T9SS type A sorting domain-containing protein, partial [Bacteroidales bacterium]|nr:T9SS type A sorting domain-containing protein [Bacteroidales bacterium]